jgi:hypothetical protein
VIRTDGINDSMVGTIASMEETTVFMVGRSIADPLPINDIDIFLATAQSGGGAQGWIYTPKTWTATTIRRLQSEGDFTAQHYKN